MSAPLVSIITPSYNSAQFLGATLASVAGQDYSPLEHIVVDGGSTDGTLDLLRASSVRWISEPDRGQTDALNKGLRLARGEIIGRVGATGRATGPHLCWRMKWRDRNLDPSLMVGAVAA